MTAKIKKKILEQIKEVQLLSGKTGDTPEEVYQSITDGKHPLEKCIIQYRLYVVNHKYTYWDTEERYIPARSKMMNFMNFCDSEMYNHNHNIDDNLTNYLLGKKSLEDVKTIVDNITKKIK